ncbi:MAG: WGR domain-containing protein [Myxococcota bacterium]|nr:WGR domain-containing protein [Myxococcota bacterium]
MNLELFGRDVELRLVDPSRNRFRVYGLTVCRTLFCEPCLRIVWGRLGNRSLRERSETFADGEALEHRWLELLDRRKRHGYVPLGIDWPSLLQTAGPATVPSAFAKRAAMEREIVESHGLSLGDREARVLVERWHVAATELRSYVRSRGETELDLEDVSTLAAMYVAVSQVA